MSDSTPLPDAGAPARGKQLDAPERLRQLWQQGQRPNVGEFLARFGPLPPAQVTAVLRIDQCHRWQSGERLPAETYLRQYPDVAAHAESALDLIYGEYLLRERSGEEVSLHDFRVRFPEHAAVLGMQVELHQAIALCRASEEKPLLNGAVPRERGAPPVEPDSTPEGLLDQTSGAVPDTRVPEKAPAPPARPGLPVLAGYDILAEVGRGGMGVIYKARQVGLNRFVALKLISAGDLAGPAELARFHTEAEAVARLQHPHVVQIYDIGHQNGLSYLALEFMDRGSLATCLAGKALAPRQAAELVETLARTVQAAHAHGIIHRDLKPANVLLTTPSAGDGVAVKTAGLTELLGVPKITDFGLAKCHAEDGGQTASGTILGTPNYMAPEQAEGKTRHVGPAADIYALGAILYEMLTGRPPFVGATLLETLEMVRSQEPVSPSRLQLHLPRDLVTICLKALAKDPRHRYPSATALADDLQRFQDNRPVKARPVSAWEQGWRWCRRKPALAALLAVVGLLAMAITTLSLVSALWLRVEAERARSAERGAIEKLLRTTIAQAQALRHTGQMGQRFESLKKLGEAVRIARSLDLLDKHSLELRNEVIACLALADLRVTEEWKIPGRWEASHDCPVAFDARLERYACSDQEGNILIRQVAGHRDVARLPSPAGKFLHADLRFSPHGRFLAVCYWLEGAVRFVLWKLPRGLTGGPTPFPTRRRQFPQEVFHIEGATFFTFSPDGHFLAIRLPDNSLRLYDLARNKAKDLNCGFVPNQMAFRPDSRQLAFVHDGHQHYVHILDLATGKVVKGGLCHPAEVHALAWSADGRLVSAASDDRNVHVWETGEWRLQAVLEGHQKRQMTALAFSPVRTLLASSNPDGTTRLWDPVRGRQLVNVPGKLLQFSADGRRLAFQRDRHIGIWEVADGRECRLLHHGRISNRTPWPDHLGAECLDFHPAGRLLLSAGGDGVRLWDLGTCREIAHLTIGHHEAAVFHPDGTRFYTHGRTGLRCWPIRADLRRDKRGQPQPGYRIGPPQDLEVRAGRGAFRACVSADGRWLAVSDFNQRRAFVLPANRSGQKIVLRDTPRLHTLALSPDGRWVAAGPTEPGTTLQVWDLRTGRLAWRSPTLHRFLLFSPDGRWLVGGGARDCRLWRTGSWKPGPIFPRDARYSSDGPLAFSRDGRLLAAPRSLQKVQLLDFASRREIATLAAPDLPSVAWLCFSPDGSRLAVANEGHTIHLWDLRAIGRTLETMGLGCALLPASSKQGSTKGSDPLNVGGQTPFSNPSPTAPRVRVWQELYEAETLKVVSAECHHFDQDMSGNDLWGREKWSSGRHRCCLTQKGGHVELEINVPETARYALKVSLTRSWDYGMVELAVDGKKVGKVFDGFVPGTVPPTRVDYGTVELREGSHRFRFTAVGKNPKSVNFFMGIDCLAVTPVK